jgi:hypothetical protein
MAFKSTNIKQSETMTFHLNWTHWTQKKPTTDDVRNPDSGFGHAATCGGVKHTNGALTLSFLITGSPTAMHV